MVVAGPEPFEHLGRGLSDEWCNWSGVVISIAVVRMYGLCT